MKSAAMKAALARTYGSLDVQDAERPTPAEGEVLVRVHATSLNAADWYGVHGRPLVARPLMGLVRPKSSESGNRPHLFSRQLHGYPIGTRVKRSAKRWRV